MIRRILAFLRRKPRPIDRDKGGALPVDPYLEKML